MESSTHAATVPTISRTQLLFNLFYSMVPLIGFWLVEKYWGVIAGIVAAVVLAIGEVVWVYWRERRWEPFAVWSAILVIGMAILSWQLEDERILLLKPAILEGVFALLFLGSSIMGRPFMLLMARKQFGNMPMGDFQTRYLSGVNWRVGILFVIHTLVTVYAALYLSIDAWFWVKGLFFYILFGIFFLGELVYSRWVLRPRMLQYWQHQQAFLEHQKQLLDRVRRKNKPAGQ